MKEVFVFSPRPFQKLITPHMMQIQNNHYGTGSGESSIYQTVAIIKGGINLIVQSMLSLSLSKMSKIDLISSKHKNDHSMQLDCIKINTQKPFVCIIEYYLFDRIIHKIKI